MPFITDDTQKFDDTFLLGLQTKEQSVVMNASCNKILCVDSTHCTNRYDFYLINLVAPDEFGRGYPVAHFITNRQDEEAKRWMFESL